jgi:hypothetical protein
LMSIFAPGRIQGVSRSGFYRLARSGVIGRFEVVFGNRGLGFCVWTLIPRESTR